MIYSIDDYPFMSAAYDGEVSGRIIPAEDVAGMKNAVRKENLALIYKGLLERTASAGGGLPIQSGAGWRGGKDLEKKYVQGYADQIRNLYGLGWFVKEDATFETLLLPSSDTSMAYNVRLAYPSCVFTEEDCTIPSIMPDALETDYLRHCFYNLERLRFGFFSRGGKDTICVDGGSVSLSAVEVKHKSDSTTYTDADYEETQVSDEFSIGSGLQEMGTSDTTSHHFTSSASAYAYYSLNYNELYSFYNIGYYYSRTGKRRHDTHELCYTGTSLYLCSPSEHSDISPAWVFVRVAIYHKHDDASSNYSGTTETAYVFVPAQVEKLADAEGFAEAFRFDIGTNKSAYHELIRLAYPSATFDLSTPGEDSYSVSISGFYVLSRKTFKSEISSLGWTWKP